MAGTHDMTMAEIAKFMNMRSDIAFRMFMNGDSQLALRQLNYVRLALNLAEERIKQQALKEAK